jgi:accessory gene regulator protein AgrB
MNRNSIKAALSSLLALVFLFMAITGAMLFFGKAGLILGFSRANVRGAHAIAAIVVCTLVPVHFILNRRLYIAELKSLKKRNKA